MTHEIVGARGRVENPSAVLERAQRWAEESRGDVLLADASAVFGREHMESAVVHALRARAQGANATRRLGLEVLRYLSGERQVDDAVRVAGLKPGSQQIAVVTFDCPADRLIESFGWDRDDAVLEAGSKSVRTLGISDVEAGTVPSSERTNLALERTALLDVMK